MPFTQNEIDFRGSLFDFTGGLNDRAQNTHIKENQASAIQNMIFKTYGPISTRNGYTEVNSSNISNNGIYGLAPYVQYDGTRFFLAVNDTKLYKLSGASWAEVGSGLTSNQYTDIIYVGGDAYLANGNENLQKFDGSTMATTGEYPASPCSYLVSLHNPPRIIAARGKDYIGRYYWCDAGSFSTWDVASYEELPNGDEIMGVGVLFGRYVIFGKDSIWMIIGTDPASWELRMVNSSVGLAAPRSVAYVQGELWFAARDGIYALGGMSSDSGTAYSFDAIGTRKVSKNIQGTWDTINQDALQLAAAGVLDNKYELSVAISPASVNDHTLYCDTNIGGRDSYPWSVFDYGFRLFANYQAGNYSELYAGENQVGKVHKLRTGTSDNGAAIDWSYATKYFDAGIEEYNKCLEDLFIWAEASGDWNVTLGYTIDFQSDTGGYSDSNLSLSAGMAGWGTMIWGVDEWRAGVDAKVMKRFFNTGDYGFTPYAGQELKKRGRNIRFKISGSTKDQYCTLIGLVLSGTITDKQTS